jgi:hypothetical protein
MSAMFLSYPIDLISGNLILGLLTKHLISNLPRVGENPGSARGSADVCGERSMDMDLGDDCSSACVKGARMSGIFIKDIWYALLSAAILNALHRGELLRVFTNAQQFGFNIRRKR